MTYARRVDANHVEIVKALRAIGCSVHSLARLGHGAPDLLVGINGRNVLLEIKADKGLLRAVQAVWRSNWHGEVHTVRSVEEAFAAISKSDPVTRAIRR